MIFYFTGTGNSLQAAGKIGDRLGESLVDIAKAVQNREYRYDIEVGETVGFVFPVYYWGLPSIVAHFLFHLELEGEKDAYCWSIITCGSNIGAADQRLRRLVEKTGYSLNAVFSVAMPDNYLPMFDVPKAEEQEAILEKAGRELESISNQIAAQADGIWSGPLEAVKTAALYPLYRKGRKTDKFYATDACVNCGRCAAVCPSQAIEIEYGKPVWVKEQCVFCMGCINRCPAEAIQYGKKTETRGRYVNPVLD
ncbi:MAG TPA: hypothetical protein DCZ20_04590 [Lachnospiraceae bacterium]|nr:hypothetical protein [Lachnospiraceae bacterium]